jgi:hypothetical protein
VEGELITCRLIVSGTVKSERLEQRTGGVEGIYRHLDLVCPHMVVSIGRLLQAVVTVIIIVSVAVQICGLLKIMFTFNIR